MFRDSLRNSKIQEKIKVCNQNVKYTKEEKVGENRREHETGPNRTAIFSISIKLETQQQKNYPKKADFYGHSLKNANLMSTHSCTIGLKIFQNVSENILF